MPRTAKARKKYGYSIIFDEKNGRPDPEEMGADLAPTETKDAASVEV